jgi:aryl-phospho-beta-D-glucosidase BglC (GH1 family)
VAVSGLEFGTGAGFSNSSPGTLGTNYFAEPAGSYTYLSGRGISCVRIAFRWERIQPTLGGSLDSTYLGLLQTQVDRANTAGLDVILDLHNFGEYATSGGTYKVGSTQVTLTHFQNLWARVADVFKNDTGVLAYELMNEPNGISDSTVESLGQYGCAAVRLVDSTHKILVPGANWQKVQGWTSHHPDKWITTYSGIVYAAHFYWDTESSPGGAANSVYQQTYASADADSQ